MDSYRPVCNLIKILSCYQVFSVEYLLDVGFQPNEADLILVV